MPNDTLAEMPSTVKEGLPTRPREIVTLRKPPRILPSVTRIGNTTSNGAPLGITARNSPIPTCWNNTISGNGSIAFPPKRSDLNDDNSLKSPIGTLRNWFLYRFRAESNTMPEKSPVFSDVIPLLRKLRLVIAPTCASVTSAAAATFGTAATIASRTCGVLSATGTNPTLIGVSFTSITLIITTIVSESASSATVIVTE